MGGDFVHTETDTGCQGQSLHDYTGVTGERRGLLLENAFVATNRSPAVGRHGDLSVFEQ
jgi:hypothetical protein